MGTHIVTLTKLDMLTAVTFPMAAFFAVVYAKLIELSCTVRILAVNIYNIYRIVILLLVTSLLRPLIIRVIVIIIETNYLNAFYH